ncbi:hypothetical protein FB451DRAFT_1182288 [Mycena latifolia]|nr:hypothetical protein FB451DRAFT_1182288 [Mycena latifolia]
MDNYGTSRNGHLNEVINHQGTIERDFSRCQHEAQSSLEFCFSSTPTTPLLWTTLPMARYTEDDDANLVNFLAHPERMFEDPRSSKLYKLLGPDAAPEFKWSRSHKPLGWQQRATLIDDLDGRILRAARDRDIKPPVKAKSKRQTPAPDDKKLSKANKTEVKFEVVLQPKDRPAYDLERDVGQIAGDFGVAPEVVRNVVMSTGSVIQARALIVAIAGSRKVDGSDEEDEEEELARSKSASRKSSSATTKRRHEEDDEDDDSCQGSQDEESSDEEQEPPKTKSKGANTSTRGTSFRQIRNNEPLMGFFLAPTKPPTKSAPKRPREASHDFDEPLPVAKKRSTYRSAAIKREPDAGHLQRALRGLKRAATVDPVVEAIPATQFYARLRPRAYPGGPASLD